MIYNLIKTTTGELISDSSEPIDLDKVVLGFPVHVVETANRDGIWNTSTLSYDPAQINKKISQDEFYARVGVERFLILSLASETDSNIKGLMNYIGGRNPVPLDSPGMILGMKIIASKELEGWTQDDIDEILT